VTLARHALITIVLVLIAAAPARAQVVETVITNGRSVTVALYPGTPAGGTGVLEKLQRRPQLSVGLLGATQGPYSVRQALLDISQGHRLSRSGYEPQELPAMRLQETGIAGWEEAVRRAGTAPADIRPGLLAESVPGGAGYVGTAGASNVEAIVAADQSGRVAEVDLGAPTDVAARARRMLQRVQLVVAALPAGAAGERALDRLVAAHRPGELLMVIRTPPRSRDAQQLPIGTIGLGDDGRAGLLRSRTTRHDGLVAGHDVLPTVLEHLELPVPEPVRGRAMFVTYDGDARGGYLRAFERRLRVVAPRRNPTLLSLAGAMLLVALAGLALRRRRPAWRLIGLGLLYVPSVALVVAALAPSEEVELLLTALGPLPLAAITDRLVPWPRAPAIPALGGVAAYVVDLAFGSPLIVQSLLGPNPRFGARWYGIGNELEAALPVMLLIGIAAAAGATARSYRLAGIFGGGMLLLGAIVGAGRLGADVGGVITIGAGGAAAVLLSLPGRLTRRRILLACAAPVAAVLALAVLDLVTGGDSHFTATVLGADDAGALADVVDRRLTLARNALLRGLMPLFTLLSIALVVLAWRRRATLYAPVAEHPAWAAALAGGAVGGIVGSLANDSGPILLVIGVVLLLGATSYVRGTPQAERRPA
jgi:hypothetical protein